MPVGNFLVGGVLRSPMHRVMSQSLLLLTFHGHRTGKEYTFPVAYTRFGPDELVVLAGYYQTIAAVLFAFDVPLPEGTPAPF